MLQTKGEGPEVGSSLVCLRNGKETETRGAVPGVEDGRLLGAQSPGRTSSVRETLCAKAGE